MHKRILSAFLAMATAFSMVGCGTSGGTTSTTENNEVVSEEAKSSEDNDSGSKAIGTVANTLAEDEDALVSTYADQFEQLTYEDADSGLSITYNLYLPDGYNESEKYPAVVFIADSSCTGDDALKSLTQGRGALVWASEEWQSANPSIVAVPTYPETILDDHSGYSTTEYVELTKRFIDYLSGKYAVDTDRIYGTGQSMGCMTTLILASEYPDLYAACMFVDGQWDVSALKGLKDQTFIYFAAEDDASAWNGMQEVMSMFDEESVDYLYKQWDGTWSVDELSEAAASLFADSSQKRYFISWKSGTIDAGNASAGGPKGNAGDAGNASAGGSKGNAGDAGNASAGGPMGDTENSGERPESAEGNKPDFTAKEGQQNGRQGGMRAGGGASYHMASFDYAYNCVAVMEWLFRQ